MEDTVKEQKFKILILFFLFSFAACKKNSSKPDQTGNTGNNNPVKVDSTYNPVDPSTPVTVGFFGNAWMPRTFTPPGTLSGTGATAGSPD